MSKYLRHTVVVSLLSLPGSRVNLLSKPHMDSGPSLTQGLRIKEKGGIIMQEAINRRKFIRNSLVLASCMVVPIAIDRKPNNSNALERLTAAIKHQCSINDAPLSEDDIEAMTYAYDKVNPQNHLEYAVVTAFSTKYVQEIGLVDEYILRKNGQVPKLFYHPVCDL